MYVLSLTPHIAVSVLLAAGIAVTGRVLRLERRQRDLAAAEKDALRRSKEEEIEKERRFENGMIEKELGIISLYEITKKMSGSLKFEEIFAVLSSAIKERFQFTRCQLAILKYGDAAAQVNTVYTVWKDDSKASDKPTADYDRLITIFTADPRDIFLSRDKDGSAMEDLKINGAVASFTGMPLLSERKMVAMLAIEDLPKQELETFAILAVQFALELKKVLLYETVEELAITDGLTGLYVRRYFFERLKEEHERSKRHKFTFAFLMADIDDFKICNDTYGHLVGDIVLKDTARIMKESVREIDIIGRYGGEEFSLVLPETGLEGARVVAERIRKRIEEHVFKAYDEKLKITISIGIAVYKGGSDSLEELIERSDKALYDAKKAGKNVVRGRDL